MKNRPTPGRRRMRAREMRQVLEELDRSRLGVVAFARERGIPLSTLRWWRAKHRDRAARRPRGRRRPPPLVEVVGARPASGSGGFEVTLRSGRVVRVPMRFEVAALQALLAALEPPC